jgi:HlyD family secretion protein
MNRTRFGILLVVILALAAAYYFLSTERDQGLVLIGTVDANQVIVSAKIGGRIERLAVDEGTQVKEGDLIAEIDAEELTALKRAAEATLASFRSQVTGTRATEEATRGTTSSDVLTAQAQVQSARAQLTEAQANLRQQQLDTQRTVSLAQQGIASQQDRDRAVAAVDAAKARVQSLQDQVRAAESNAAAARARTNQAHTAESTVQATAAQMQAAQAQLAQAQTRLQYTKVTAPVSGVVSVRAARQGEVVNAGTPIVTIMDLNDTWVRAAIPETYADKLQLGDTLDVRMPNGSTVASKLIFKNTEGDFATQRDVSRQKRDIKTVALKIKIDNAGMKYATGMTAEVLVPWSKLNAKDAATAQK